MGQLDNELSAWAKKHSLAGMNPNKAVILLLPMQQKQSAAHLNVVAQVNGEAPLL
jgi:hypothetical protein